MYTEAAPSTNPLLRRRAPIRLVTFTTLYPNAAQPTHGIFVENRLRHLIDSGEVESQVIAPAPWVPNLLAELFPTYAAFARIPRAEVRHGIEIQHPRFLVLPKIGMIAAPFLLFWSSLQAIRRAVAETGDFDLIDAHYFYPDGVAAALIGAMLHKPVVITARGSDINLIAKYWLPRKMIRYAGKKAAGVIAVSRALRDALVAMGIPAAKIHVLRNGVDLAAFTPLDRGAMRTKWNCTGRILLSVGQLVELKGHDLVIEALRELPNFSLLIVGQGPQRANLERVAQKSGVAKHVRFLGSIPHEKLKELYSCADALVLASSREGWPNVLLEAMACGTPVIASNVGGIPEVVTRPEAGLLLSERTPSGIAATVKRLFRELPDRNATRRFAESFSWEGTSEGQVQLFRQISGST